VCRDLRPQSPEVIASHRDDLANLFQLGHHGVLRDEASESDVGALAGDIATSLPRPADAAPPVDMDRPLGDRLNRAQRDVMHRLRRKLADLDV
jgi:hypothetical protein